MNTTWLEGKSGIKALITGYAYETQPKTAITAGDEGSGTTVDPASDSMPQTNPAESHSATLGALALGANAVPLWRAGK